MRRAGLTLCICLNIGIRTVADKSPSAASPLLDVLKVRRRRVSTTSNKIVEQALQRFLLMENWVYEIFLDASQLASYITSE